MHNVDLKCESHIYKGITAVLCALPTQYHAVLLIALYGGCAGLMFVLYKLGVRNFNRLQYSRFLSGSQKR